MSGTGSEGLALPQLDPAPRILLVVAPYYAQIAAWQRAGARAALAAAGAEPQEIAVPGALEIPPAIRLASASGRFDGYVALGCVIRGETTHYETVCEESARGLTLLGIERGLCIGNGILTCESLAQAEERADPARQDKAGGAALAALHLVALARRFGPGPDSTGAPAEPDILLAGGGLSRTA
ncbi:MAG: 6,7-dimethyl-8-ribityllumazine synthase [Pikeienuella sp.]